jgi:hypothetical protein
MSSIERRPQYFGIFISMEIFSRMGPHFKFEPIESELFCGPHLKFESAFVISSAPPFKYFRCYLLYQLSASRSDGVSTSLVAMPALTSHVFECPTQCIER